MSDGEAAWGGLSHACSHAQHSRHLAATASFPFRVCVPYLRNIGVCVGVARGVVAQSGETGQDEVDGADLQSHAAQQHAVVGRERRAAEERAQDVER